MSGSPLASVEGQSGMYEKLVNWLADADVHIQSLRIDWRFMWREYSDVTSAGNAMPTKPADLAEWDQESFYLDYTKKGHRRLNFKDYAEWKRGRGRGVLKNRRPDGFTIQPNNQIVLFNPPDAAYDLTADYWAKPKRMKLNTDISPIPEQHERVIVVQAKLYYAEEQEIPHVRDEALRELNGYGSDQGLLKTLKASQLPGSQGRIMGKAPDITIRPE